VKDICIVILNWNGSGYLHDFLPSVIAHSGDARIVVADNASTDHSVALIRSLFPQVDIISHATNHGFALGYNLALQKIDSPYYLLLNSDIEVTPGWLIPLKKHILSSDKIAGVQPKVLSYQNRLVFEHAGASGGFLDSHYFPFCRGRIFAHIEADHQQYDHACEVFWATGAALLIRSDVFHLLEGFDPSFFAHMEEIDLCWRAKKLGFSFYVEPTSIVYHVGGGTLPYASPYKTYLNFRNSLYMIIKNYEGWLLPTLFIRMGIDGVAGLRFLYIGEFKNLLSVVKAHGSVYQNFISLLKKRRQIKKHSKAFLRARNIRANKNGLYQGSILWAYYVKGVKQFTLLNQRLFKR